MIATRRAVNRRRKARRGPLRDKRYLAFLRRQTCFVRYYCAGPTEAAHGPVNGMRSKGPDNEAIPPCTRHHREQHVVGIRAFQSARNFDWKATAARYYEQYLSGGGE